MGELNLEPQFCKECGEKIRFLKVYDKYFPVDWEQIWGYTPTKFIGKKVESKWWKIPMYPLHKCYHQN